MRGSVRPTPPRLGFAGAGWIGHHRLRAIAACGLAKIAAIADPDGDARRRSLAVCPCASAHASFDELLDLDLDGVVLATPSALHTQQSIAVLERGMAVHCQKPLGLSAAETAAVVAAAERGDLPLGVDFSYRHTAAMRRIRELCSAGELGHVYAADLAFHNGYGPDKPWFYERGSSGGGCVMDLGIHLVDLALWVLDFPTVEEVRSRIYAGGTLLMPGDERVEDFAVAELALGGGATARIACSWHQPVGCDAIIHASFLGTAGGMTMDNLDGSFYDFVCDRCTGTRRQRIATPPDPWGGRSVVDWVRQLAAGAGFDPQSWRLVDVAEVVDRIYETPRAWEAGTRCAS